MSQTAPSDVVAIQKKTSGINPRILLLTLSMFALGTDAFVITGVLPVIAHEMNVSESLAGQLITVFSFTYGFGAPILAVAIARWPRNQVLLALQTVSIAQLGWIGGIFVLLSLILLALSVRLSNKKMQGDRGRSPEQLVIAPE